MTPAVLLLTVPLSVMSKRASSRLGFRLTLLVAQVDSAEAAALSVGDRVRVEIAPTPILVVAS